jgi:predicted translin family RNA/ssDNA-binding protein
MLAINELKKIKQELVEFDKQRETTIIISRSILKLSKSAIYSTHRNELEKAKKSLIEAESNIKKITKLIKKIPTLRTIGAYSSALEEYVEAKCFLGFITDKKLPKKSQLPVTSEEYLLGLCDLTGELSRLAVISATNKKFKKVKEIRDVVEEIFGFLSSIDLRNGELRKKSDSIKWNLKKIEDILYDISMKK